MAKFLTYESRLEIEAGLREHLTFTEIGIKLLRDRTTKSIGKGLKIYHSVALIDHSPKSYCNFCEFLYNDSQKGGRNMTDFFAEYLTEILIINGIIYADRRDFYMYGLDLFFIKLSFYVTILVLSLITNTLPISILYVLLFTMLRKYTGGYHSKTFTLCFLTSILIYLVMILIYRIAVETVAAPMTICAVISFIIVILLAPVESINKPLSADEQKKYRIISLILVSIYCLASVITLNLNYYWVSFVLSWSLTADAVLIILGKFMKGEVHNEEGSVKSNC